MEKTISAFEARRNFGRVLQDVIANDDKIIVERHGEPVAVVVPVSLYRQWQRSRQEAFENIRRMAEQANVPEDEARELIEEAINAVRAEQRATKSA